MHRSHKKTVINVLILYLSSTILLVSILAFGYYKFQSDVYKSEEKTLMKESAKTIYIKLQEMQNQLNKNTKYPRFESFNSALYDIDKNELFSLLENKTLNLDFAKNYFQDKDFSYYIYEMEPYYMGSAFIVIEQKSRSVFESLKLQVIYISLILIIFLVLTSIFLVKLIVKPLSDNAMLLDRFIKDTTHELNTPISTILTNIEMLENLSLEEKIKKKICRVKMASLTISNLYEDLTFLLLNHKVSSLNEKFVLNRIIKQRVEYFDLLIKAKNLSVNLKEENQLEVFADVKKITRVIDNLLSNAIKYTNDNTNIDLMISKNSFSIKDEGNGMTKEEISVIFERFTRFDESKGGFGLGYNIIYTIVKEYDIKIKIDSKKSGGTCVTLLF